MAHRPAEKVHLYLAFTNGNDLSIVPAAAVHRSQQISNLRRLENSLPFVSAARSLAVLCRIIMIVTSVHVHLLLVLYGRRTFRKHSLLCHVLCERHCRFDRRVISAEVTVCREQFALRIAAICHDVTSQTPL